MDIRWNIHGADFTVEMSAKEMLLIKDALDDAHGYRVNKALESYEKGFTHASESYEAKADEFNEKFEEINSKLKSIFGDIYEG